MNVAHARETKELISLAIKYGVLTEDDLNQIDVIILSRLEELDEEINC